MDKINFEIVTNEDDIFNMLDSLLETGNSKRWDDFYADKEKSIPFFKNIPDENLISYFDRGILSCGKALDIGCGNGRNSLFLSEKGFSVTGVDLSKTSIDWAKQTAKEQNLKVDFICQSIFDFKNNSESFDFIYESGCFHHILPHRREQYLKMISGYLKTDGYFSMTCFNLKGGANISDYDVYRKSSMDGGLGFTEHKLKTILQSYFEIIEFREMVESYDENIFGKSILWTVLMKKK